MAERIAAHAHETHAAKGVELIDPAFVTSLGLLPDTITRLMRDIGFRPDGAERAWQWRGRGRKSPPPAKAAPHWGALAELKRG